MILKNNSARLITINGAMVNNQRVKAFQIRPGNNPNADVPDELCNNAFVKALLADGSLIKVGESAKVEIEVSEYSDMSKADLVALCEVRQIETTSRDTVKTLSGKLEEQDAE